MKSRRQFVLSAAALAGLVSLGACSGPYTVSADVNSFGTWPAERAGVSYAFERLPSQKDSRRQDELEESARGALEKAGFKPALDTRSADILVTLGARLSATEYAPWDDPLWARWHGAWGVRYGGVWGGGWRGGPRLGFGSGIGWSNGPWLDRRYDREVAVLMRDRVSNEPVYEAHASHETLSPGDDGVLSALFQAALADFPNAEPKSHRVTVQAMR